MNRKTESGKWGVVARHSRAGGNPVKKTRSKQQGFALLLFVTVLATAAATLTVKALNNNGNTQIDRDKITAAALAQAKDALIGYATSDPVRPGELPCPDINNDGIITISGPNADYVGNNCISLIGRLPWRTLGLPDLRDANGERLWYALSDAFHANDTAVLNSDSTGTLNITGIQTTNNVIAIVFSSGNTLPGQNRSATQIGNCSTTSSSIAANLCATNYLEGNNSNRSTSTSPNLNYQTASSSATFNDQLILITSDQILSVIEKRIAHEAKSCLDNYAANPLNLINQTQRYPWPVPVSDVSTYLSRNGILFGRLPVDPTFVTLTAESNANNLMSDLSALQTALNNYAASNTSTTRDALNSTGNTLLHFNNQGPSTVSVTSVNNANTAGNKAQDLAKIHPNSTVSAVQTSINNTRSSLVSDGLLDSNVPIPWPSSCTLFASNYWQDWRDMVFYQVANGYQPGSSANCIGCLSITGSGNSSMGSGTYRATVLVSRRAISGQVRNRSDSTTYLENPNQHQVTITTSFEAYKSSDPNYSTVNDLVLCLDGKNNCQ
ncbi:MAG: hypothetical protein WCK93_12275 [Nitrosomonadales bacterium]